MSSVKELTLEFLKIIADQTRFEIISLLKVNDLSSATIQEELGKSQSTISQHLKTLRNTQLIDYYKKERFIEVNNPKKPGKKNKIPISTKIYRIKSKSIIEFLNKAQSLIIELNKEKLRDVREYDVEDTLL